MFYIGVNADDPNILTYYCRNCKTVDNSVSTEGGCILNVQMKASEQKVGHIINQFTKFDPTLPRIYNMKCPNKECQTNTANTPAEIIYIRYDDDNLKYVYMCVECDTTWKTNEQKN